MLTPVTLLPSREEGRKRKSENARNAHSLLSSFFVCVSQLQSLSFVFRLKAGNAEEGREDEEGGKEEKSEEIHSEAERREMREKRGTIDRRL